MEKDTTNPESEQEQENGNEEQEEESSSDSTDEEEKTDYRAKLNATNRFLEKEGYKFEEGKWNKPTQKEEQSAESTPQSQYSLRDIHALSDVHIDDIDDVERAAKLLNKSIADAKKDPVVQAILKSREEERKSADASNTKGGKTPTKTPSSSDVLKKASQGEFPKPGSEEAEKLFRARRGGEVK